MIFVISPKNAYAVARLRQEAKYLKQELMVLDIADLIACQFKIFANPGDVLYIRNPYLNGNPKYLPNIIKLAKTFQAQGGRAVDGAIVRGDLGKGKWRDYQKLKKAGLLIPPTEIFKSHSLLTNHYPVVLKWIYGMKGKGTFLIKAKNDLENIPISIPTSELMAQEYIKAKYEYKVITVGYKALPVTLRFKFDKERGRIVFTTARVVPIHRLPKRIIKLAERASKTLGRELAKVDISEDQKGRLFILEVNRFPGLESFEKLTKYNVFNGFIKYLQT